MPLKTVTIKGENEFYSNDDLFDIRSWGADLSFRELITMYKEGETLKPALQRKYIWTQNEASRFIDSILLGLPVPSIFLAKTDEEKKLIVDGYQRIMTVYDFVERGIFANSKKTFKLTKSASINKRWRGKAFKELTDDEQRRIKATTIHAIIFEQKHPNDDSGMYQIFERINTGGKTLKPQEIRNCVYHGPFNNLLMKLNKYNTWRLLLNEQMEDSRMADTEYILRFFALFDLQNRPERKQTQISLKKYLNDYMNDNRNLTKQEINKKDLFFKNIIDTVNKLLTINAFRNLSSKISDKNNKATNYIAKIHPTIFDAVTISTGIILASGQNPETLFRGEKMHRELLRDKDFKYVSTHRTTNIENIKKRIELASKYLYGEENIFNL